MGNRQYKMIILYYPKLSTITYQKQFILTTNLVRVLKNEPLTPKCLLTKVEK